MRPSEQIGRTSLRKTLKRLNKELYEFFIYWVEAKNFESTLTCLHGMSDRANYRRRCSSHSIMRNRDTLQDTGIEEGVVPVSIRG